MRLSTVSTQTLWTVGCVLLVAATAILYAFTFVRHVDVGFDLHVFWKAARDVAHGASPYDPGGVARMRVAEQRDPTASPLAGWAVYPPGVFLAMVPLGLLPWPVAAVIGTALLALCPALALRIMGVRDWRCYAIVYGSAPIYTGIMIGTISTALMVGLALIWRGRSTAGAGAVTIVAKLFLWPVVAAVAGLEGLRRALRLSAIGALLLLVPWAVIGFADIERYPTILGDLSVIEAHNSFSATGLAYALDVPLAIGTYAGALLGLAVAALAFRAGRRGQRDSALTLALAAALLASPIVWLHYLVLLFIPIAARYPRANVVWLFPLLLWGHVVQAADGSTWALVLVWATVAMILAATVGTGEWRTRRSFRPWAARQRGAAAASAVAAPPRPRHHRRWATRGS